MLVVTIVGCDGAQSTLTGAGLESARVRTLFWVMAASGAGIWMIVMAVAYAACRADAASASRRRVRLLILGAGVAWPLATILALLCYALMLSVDLRVHPGVQHVRVEGELWWWRVTYAAAGGRPVEVANEIRLPAGAATTFTLTSDEVIHSFWIPALGGKMDMIPGRTTTLTLQPERTGRYRGVCAEFCGSSHAQMAFDVVVMEPVAFERWIGGQAQDSVAPSSVAAAEGERQFRANGCGACHTIRGTASTGRTGPDLTHFASRSTLAASTRPNDKAALEHWLARPASIKPGSRMPSYAHLPDADRSVIADYLLSLQ